MKKCYCLLLVILVSSSVIAQTKIKSNADKEAAYDAYDKGEYQTAISRINKYLASFPKDTNATMVKASAYSRTNQHKQCILLIKKFFGKNKVQSAKWIAEMGYENFGSDTSNSFTIYADSAYYMDKKNPIAIFLQAYKTLFNSNLNTPEKKELANAEAIGLAEELKMLITEEDRPRLTRCYVSILFDADEKDQAISTAKNYIEKYPKDSYMYDVLTVLYKRTKKLDLALSTLNEKLRKASIDSAADIKNRYDLYEELGNSDEKCQDAEILYHLGKGIYYGYRCAWATKNIFSDNTDHLIYAVKTPSGTNNFDVQLFSYKKNEEIGFNWILGNIKGRLLMNAQALTSSVVQKSYYLEQDKDLSLTDMSSVWVSKKVFDELKENGFALYNISGKEKKFIVLKREDEIFEENNNTDEYYRGEVKLKGETFFTPFIHARTEDKTEEIWILNNPLNPLILKMKLGWEIELVSVN